MINNKKLKTFSIFLLLCTNLIFSQEEKKDFWKQVRFGGSVGLNFGDSFFNATIAPSGIYEFNDTYALGLGLNTTFINQQNIAKTTILGGSVIGLANIIPELQASTEFEHLHVSRTYNVNLNYADEQYWIPALYLGIGYRADNIIIGIRYDVLYDEERSLYLDPWMPFLRIYF